MHRKTVFFFLSEKIDADSTFNNFPISENAPVSVYILLLQIDNKYEKSCVLTEQLKTFMDSNIEVYIIDFARLGPAVLHWFTADRCEPILRCTAG